jgi:hypothetical protein
MAGEVSGTNNSGSVSRTGVGFGKQQEAAAEVIPLGAAVEV